MSDQPTKEQLRPFNIKFQEDIALFRLSANDVAAMTRAARANGVLPAQFQELTMPQFKEPGGLVEFLKNPHSARSKTFVSLNVESSRTSAPQIDLGVVAAHFPDKIASEHLREIQGEQTNPLRPSPTPDAREKQFEAGRLR